MTKTGLWKLSKKAKFTCAQSKYKGRCVKQIWLVEISTLEMEGRKEIPCTDLLLPIQGEGSLCLPYKSFPDLFSFLL